jgi:hypothetical protein
MQSKNTKKIPATTAHTPFAQTFFHGSKADLKIGDLIETGLNSNYIQERKAKYIYLTSTLDAAVWGAELAAGEGREIVKTSLQSSGRDHCLAKTLPCTGQSHERRDCKNQRSGVGYYRRLIIEDN